MLFIFIFLITIYLVLKFLPELILFFDARKEFKKNKNKLKDARDYKISILKHPDEIDETIRLINKKMSENTDNTNLN